MIEEKKNISEDMVELSMEELGSVVGGLNNDKGNSNDICPCGRGKIIKNGLCKHCNDLNANA